MVGLSAARDKRPAQLSGGMRQRVALARAHAVEPAILLMDEPLSALDALTRATLQDELARIHKKSGATMVMVTNDVDEAVLLADRIVPLSAGPGATLGPSFQVDIERPRDRRAVNHIPAFKEVRKQVLEFLMASSAAKRSPRVSSAVPQLAPVLT
jgi:nitrate/nitrite transport system ATP-binding protein